ncbi:MAG: heavy-metal-associated domain-containing protein [bacterium]|nr:MAG: heavy-metal-associated domain-containing protein [bacterium]
MSRMKIKIDGMSCNHCKMAVENTLSNIQGIESFSVNLEKGEAEIIGNPDQSLIVDEINKLGYKTTLAE